MTALEPRLSTLGITPEHCSDCKLPACNEAEQLVSAGNDIFDRPQRMTREACLSWTAMKKAAANDDIVLQLVSSFRSIDYQCQLIQNKLDAGVSLDEILKVNAIPGYSEHHSGRALDLTTKNYPPLEEDFEDSSAFSWLVNNAQHFRFHLSYPRENVFGIAYEPWHWAYRP